MQQRFALRVQSDRATVVPQAPNWSLFAYLYLRFPSSNNAANFNAMRLDREEAQANGQFYDSVKYYREEESYQPAEDICEVLFSSCVQTGAFSCEGKFPQTRPGISCSIFSSFFPFSYFQ
jgi:hypothetical protein